MKKILVLILIIFCGAEANAQLNNSWIDYSKTYYKFKIAQDTLCRIYGSTLAANGMQNIPVQDFQLWRNGKEVRLYTSVSSGTLGNNDFIEFWGMMNDGEPDNQLYRNPDFQLNKKYSLETDTVAYFLTVNPAGNNLRFEDAANNPPGSMQPDAYFMRTEDKFYKKQLNRGLAYVVEEYVYSSAYDIGEGWTTSDPNPCCEHSWKFLNLNVYNTGPQNSFSIKVNATGNAPNNDRNLKIRLYDNEVYNQPMPGFSYLRAQVDNLPLTMLQNLNQAMVYVNGTSANTNDRFNVASISITYPAKFIFNNQKFFEFSLQPSITGNYLIISSFNYGTVAPALYDKTTGKRYLGDISQAGKVKFVLPPSTETRNFLLVSQDNYSLSINNLITRNFVDFSNTANQGDYLIITNKILFNDGNGNNYCEDYRAYRSSEQGGNNNAKIYEIDELTDQFAFGIKNHPGSVRDFIRYAKSNFSVTPKFAFIIGRGVTYPEARANESNPVMQQIDLVPTFGWPASDHLLVSEPGLVKPLVSVGRLAAISPADVNAYLNKVKEYEYAQQNPQPGIAASAWMKNFLHVAGGKTVPENESFKAYMNGYKEIAEDTLLGAHVETFTKTSTSTVQQENNERIRQLFNTGLGFIGYFGHSSANTFEFNLSDPNQYDNAGKYPFFNVSGCSAGNFYVFDPQRINGNMSISEKYVLTPNRGSIAFLADTHFGIPPFLNFYNTYFYKFFSYAMYGKSVGEQIDEVINRLGGSNPNVDYLYRIHLEEIALHGDPQIKINYSQKPDYAIEEPLVKISPAVITVADNSFNLKINMKNIGKAIDDSMRVTVSRKLPNETIINIYDQKIKAILNEDSLEFNIDINPLVDKGRNTITVTLDSDDEIEELFESNNSVTKEFYIFEDEVRPVFPYDFSIINSRINKFYASTANAMAGVKTYLMEIDTTENFNSSIKKNYSISGPGGLVEFSAPDLSLNSNTVYYWRVAIQPEQGAETIWNIHSFVYLPASTEGYNQSHYFQHLKSKYEGIVLRSDRTFAFEQRNKNLTIRTGLYPYFNYDRINVNLDFEQLEYYGCKYNSLQFYVFDSASLTPWRNRNVNGSGLYGSAQVCPSNLGTSDTSRIFFEFPYNDPQFRKNAMDFIDAIPAGKFVAITNYGNKNNNASFIAQWMNDTLALGSGNSLYHKLKSIGFTKIDSFTRNVPFLYFFQKEIPSYAPTQVVGLKDTSYIDRTFVLKGSRTDGYIESPVFGPVKSWDMLRWNGHNNDVDPSFDTMNIQIYGVKQNGQADLLTTVYEARDTSINFIDADVYPYVKLRLNSSDKINVTPYQLDFWRVNGSFVPEGAVAPGILFQMADSVDQGTPIEFALAFKNVSQTSFDSMMKVRFVITDRNNEQHEINIAPRKIITAGDTLTLRYAIPSEMYAGMNTLFVEFNPANDQREQFHFNNILYKTFYVKEDKVNPLLDITFDGVHILNRDIVSSKPSIIINLKDENRFLLLKDTSLIKVFVRFPNESTPRRYYFNDTMRFIPPLPGAAENTATIDFRPYFAEDGEYELIVTGRDVVGNNTGELDYHVLFSVINKPMISNMLNYPNPFTTSTAFVFTLTGSKIPQNIRIQILTVTGKIVREINSAELGPIHIGRNITEFKWDGTDMYGQKLANGVYLYRVLTNLDGKGLDKYRASGDNTDKFFNKGYGKMYLMR